MSIDQGEYLPSTIFTFSVLSLSYSDFLPSTVDVWNSMDVKRPDLWAMTLTACDGPLWTWIRDMYFSCTVNKRYKIPIEGLLIQHLRYFIFPYKKTLCCALQWHHQARISSTCDMRSNPRFYVKFQIVPFFGERLYDITQWPYIFWKRQFAFPQKLPVLPGLVQNHWFCVNSPDTGRHVKTSQVDNRSGIHPWR